MREAQSTQVGLLARVPKKGHGKRRLARELGEYQAYFCVHRLLLTALEATAPYATTIWYEGDDEMLLQDMVAGQVCEYRPQPSGTIGHRMYTAMNAGARVVIGSDIPRMSADYISRALYHLNSGYDLALGPAEDGGYCLIGMNEPREELFEGISWSSDMVLKQTLLRAEEINLRIVLLPTLWDVDTFEDFHRWVAEDGIELSW